MPLVDIPVEITAVDASGNAYPALYVGSNNRGVFLAFNLATIGVAYGKIKIPQNYLSGGAIKLRVFYASITANSARWVVRWLKVATAASVDGAYTAETAQDITVPGTAPQTQEVTFTLTGFTPAVGDEVYVQIERTGNHANDTAAADSYLESAVLQYTA